MGRWSIQVVRRVQFLACLSGFLLAAWGCARSAQSPTIVTSEDYKAWYRICEALIAKKGKALKIHASSFQALSDELAESPETVADLCRANGMEAQRFFEVCRAIGLAHSVLSAEKMDAKAARRSAVEMAGDLACKDHEAVEAELPRNALGPQSAPPPVLQEGSNDALRQNVALLRPVSNEVDALAARILARPPEGVPGGGISHAD